jgi:hypothetical protein
MIDLRIMILKIGQLSKTGHRYRRGPPEIESSAPASDEVSTAVPYLGSRCQNLPIDNGMSLTISQRVQSGGRPVGVLSMRNILLLCLGLLAAYWIDQTYFGGAYSRPTIDMLHHIIDSYR